MPTLNELITLYRGYSDYQLFEIYLQAEEYTEDARLALETIVDEKGGVENLMDRVEFQQKCNEESVDLSDEIFSLLNNGKSASDLHILLKPTFLSKEQFSNLIESEADAFDISSEDRTIRFRTVLGGLIGAMMGGTLSGIMWGIVLVYSKLFVWFLALPVFVVTYVPIRLITRQSTANLVVLLLTIVFSLLAFWLGYSIFDVVGYKGAK